MDGDVLYIWTRDRTFINTDPQRRCYNGCHFSGEYMWTKWGLLETIKADAVEHKLKFWRELNDYAVSQRGQSALREFDVRDYGEILTPTPTSLY